jgi:hypothetical protein
MKQLLASTAAALVLLTLVGSAGAGGRPNGGKAEDLGAGAGAVVGGGAGAFAGAAAEARSGGNLRGAGAAAGFEAGRQIGESAGRKAGRYLDERAEDNRSRGRGGANDPRFDPFKGWGEIWDY